MERLVKNVVGPRESGYIKEQDLRKFLLKAFGSEIRFNIRVRKSMAKHAAASYADLYRRHRRKTSAWSSSRRGS